MKKKLICKIVIDMIMTFLRLFLMAWQLTGDSAPEKQDWQELYEKKLLGQQLVEVG